MQTVYQTISIRPRWEAPRAEEKIIDLAQYRRKLEREQQTEWEEPEVQPRVRSSQRRNRWGLYWDAVASLGVVAMAVTFCVELLL
ncbi:hypothetical protein QUW63_13125 [Pseudoflavonifractor phocaeensis]|uniref:hypothetical protein n=1 Tax=Pseudoflavonifractor phocaeensis TaxID=1870988 RepID=UPI0025A37A32|nr:hypothetical protein [Pseudoflavonifractor phocaeensis]MDM8240033.1 hypothetical protein [Pseudoflavonifractor phocaeensis]